MENIRKKRGIEINLGGLGYDNRVLKRELIKWKERK